VMMLLEPIYVKGSSLLLTHNFEDDS